MGQDNGDLVICFLATKTNDPKYKYLVKLIDEASKAFRDNKNELDDVSFTYVHFNDEKNEKMLKNYGFEESNGNQIAIVQLKRKPGAGYDRQPMEFMDFNSDEYFPGKVKIYGAKITKWVHEFMNKAYPKNKKWAKKVATKD